MSDLAPIFTDVAEALRCQTVQDLKNENEDLQDELNKTRIVVSRVSLSEQPRMEQTVAEGFLEQMETLTLADIPERYSTFLRNDDDDDDDEDLYYAVKLQTTDACIGRMPDFEDSAFVVRLDKTNSSAILGVFGEGPRVHRFEHGCLLCTLTSLDQDEPHTMVELKQPAKKAFHLNKLGFKVIPFDNHPYWDDLPGRNRREGHEMDWLYIYAANEFVNNSPENSAEHVFEYLFFRPVEVSEFLDTL